MQPKKTTGASAQNQARRPSGFGHTHQPARPAARTVPEGKPAPKAVEKPVQKPASSRRRRSDGERRPVSRRVKIILGILAALLALYLALALIFGGGRTVHQLPLVMREADITPAPTATAEAAETGEVAA